MVSIFIPFVSKGTVVMEVPTLPSVVGGRGPLLGRFSEPRGRATTLAVIADPHVSPTAEGTWKLYHRTEARLQAAIADINRLAVDAAVIVGDLTRDGHPREFDRLDELLDTCAVPVLAVPGNHDVSKEHDDHRTPSLLEFVSRYTPGSLPFVKRVGSVDVIGLNTASMPDESLDGTHRGAVSQPQLDWLERTLPGMETPIVAMHHTAAAGSDHTHRGMKSDEYRMANAEQLAAVLGKHDVPLCLTGHIHWPSVAPFTGGYEIVAPATCSFPQAYLLVHVEPRGTTIEIVPLADQSGLIEAYDAAREHPRGSRLIDSTDAGYFQRFPLVDSSPMWVV
jgi:Icc protein